MRPSLPRAGTLAMLVVTGLAVVLAACGRTTPAAPSTGRPPATTAAPAAGGSPTSGQAPAPPESNPPGDIPDSQVFVGYRTPARFSVKVPEGWGRTRSGSAATFTDRLNSVTIEWKPAKRPPTVAGTTAVDVPALRRTSRAFTLGGVSTVTLPAGPAVRVAYQQNSVPNPVTGKQYRLEVLRYSLFHADTEAVLTLSSPVGSDNVDPWRTITESLQWP